MTEQKRALPRPDEIRDVVSDKMDSAEAEVVFPDGTARSLKLKSSPEGDGEITKMQRRLERLSTHWDAKPAGTGESVGSENFLFNGRYRHPRASIRSDK